MDSLGQKIPADSPLLWGLVGAGSTSLVLLAGFGLYRLTRRFPTIDHVPLRYFSQPRRLHGVALRVGDADGFRFYHTPWFRRAPAAEEAKGRSFMGENTISVRLAGVDAPEMGHFGAKAQPFSAEAKQCLEDLVLGKKVSIQIPQRDQYNRAV